MAANIASKNTYSGINPKVVKHLRYQSQRLKTDKAFANEDIEDIEQDLLLDCLPLLSEYDELAENYEAFVGQLIKRRASNLRNNRLCKKRIVDFVDEIEDKLEEAESFEYDTVLRIDVNEIIAKLPTKSKEICELLKKHDVAEVSRRTGISKSTLYETIERLREDFSDLKEYRFKLGF